MVTVAPNTGKSGRHQCLNRAEILVDEYRVLLDASDVSSGLEYEIRQIDLALKRVRTQEDRFTEAYANEGIDLKRYKTETVKLQAHQRAEWNLSRTEPTSGNRQGLRKGA